MRKFIYFQNTLYLVTEEKGFNASTSTHFQTYTKLKVLYDIHKID